MKKLLFTVSIFLVLFPTTVISGTPETFVMLYNDPVIDELQPYKMANESAVTIQRREEYVKVLIIGDRERWYTENKYAFIYFKIDLFNASFGKVYFLNQSKEATYYTNELHYDLLETIDPTNYTEGRWIFYTGKLHIPNENFPHAIDRIALDSPQTLRVLSHTYYNRNTPFMGLSGDADFFMFTITNIDHPAYMKITVLKDENGVWGTHDKFYINHQRINPDYIPLTKLFVINQGNEIPIQPNQGIPSESFTPVTVLSSVILPVTATTVILIRKTKIHPQRMRKEKESTKSSKMISLARKLN